MTTSRLFAVIIPGIFLPVLLFYMSACTHDPVGIESFDTICFDQVMNIVSTQCGYCHDGTTVEGFSAYDPQAILNMVKAGDPRGSQLYQVITDIRGENFMPPDKPLSKENRMIIEIWIAQGAIQCAPSDTGNHGNNGKSCSDSTYFVQSVLPIIANKCAFCHDGTAYGDEDHVFILNDYTTVKPYTRPSDPPSSPLYTVLNRSGDERMPLPPYDPLAASDKATILKWIKEGAHNNSCTSAGCDTVSAITYANQIEPIIRVNCTSCHSDAVTQAGINLSTYDQVKAVATTIQNNQSRLIGVITHAQGFSAMPLPPASKLDNCSIREIELWIDQGLN